MATRMAKGTQSNKTAKALDKERKQIPKGAAELEETVFAGRDKLDATAWAASTGPSKRTAVAVSPEAKRENLARLSRIEGQVRGIAKMVEQERYCADIVVQVASVQEALRGVARGLMRNHLQHCATEAFAGGETKREAMYDELLELIYKHLR